MPNSQKDAVDAQQLVENAVELLNEALVLLDTAMIHQPAALIDLAINILCGWAPESSVLAPGEPH